MYEILPWTWTPDFCQQEEDAALFIWILNKISLLGQSQQNKTINSIPAYRWHANYTQMRLLITIQWCSKRKKKVIQKHLLKLQIPCSLYCQFSLRSFNFIILWSLECSNLCDRNVVDNQTKGNYAHRIWQKNVGGYFYVMFHHLTPP
jgi:hypothetical protein